jgi:tetratricopeptide (TPR) repeat protein
VISFENLTGDTTYNYLQKAIPNLLITSLEQSQYLQVTTWERMNDLLKQMGKENVEVVDKNLGFELCRMDGVDIIVLGSFTKAGEMFATDVKVLNVSTKAMVKSASAKGAGIASILENQIDDLSKEISRGIGLSERKIEAAQVPIAEVTTTSMEAYNYFIRGREYYEKYYEADAMRLFERAVELDSTFATAYIYLAGVYAGLGETSKSAKALEKAKVYANMTSEKERLFIEAEYTRKIEGNPEKADSILQRIAQKYPKDKRAHWALGGHFIDQKQYDKAIEEFNKVLALDPQNGLFWNALGYVYARIEDFTKAFECLQRYAALSPGDANPLDTMAEFYLKMGDVDAAITKFKEVQAIKPDFDAVDWRLAYCYGLKEDYAEAMKRLDRHLAMHSNPSSFYYMRGFFHYFQGRTRQALKDLQRTYQVADSMGRKDYKSEVERLRGWIYFDRGEFDAGWIAIKKLINNLMEETTATETYHKQYYSFYRGMVNVKLGQIDSAKYHLEVIKSVLPMAERDKDERPQFHYDLLRAEILLAEDAAENALAVSQTIHLLGFEITYMGIPDPTFVYNLPFRNDVSVRAYQKLGNLDGAIAEYERLTTIDQTNRDRRFIPARFHYRLAKLYEQKGLAAKAMARYEHFLNVWKNADPDWPELSDAKARLARLKGKVKK